MPRGSFARPCPANRFWLKVDVREPEECWPWLGPRLSTGYGMFWLHGQNRGAHRIAYELAKGPIPEGLTIDHLCRNHPCVNPLHLEPVTIRENSLRGESRAAHLARAVRCIRGHPFDEENTYIRNAKGHRSCRTCMRWHARLRGRRKRAAA